MKYPKVVVASVPFVDEDTPLVAPALLKAVLQAQDIECVALDLNIQIYNFLKTRNDKHLFLEFFYQQNCHDSIVDDLSMMFDLYMQEIMPHKPDIIGLSLFSEQSQCFTVWLSALLKQQYPKVKIVIGGPGLSTLENGSTKFPDRLKSLGYIDDYITGDAEQSLVEYVKGNKNFPGINSHQWSSLKDINNQPYPDYSDYRFINYRSPLLHLIDSRGCVQNCEFCDVIGFWEKFRYKSAESIFKQMLYYIEQYRVYRFQFASSICNGNLREFKKLVKMIAEYNSNKAEEEQMSWLGSFIIRKAKHHNAELWKNIKQSNGFLFCGVESIVPHVRIALGKNFDNDDLDHHLKMAHHYDVPMNLLLIAGYYTETKEDYEYAKDWFRQHKQFANNPVQQVQLTLITVLPGTRLEQSVDIEKFKNGYEQRYNHAKDLQKVIEDCGFHTRTFF